MIYSKLTIFIKNIYINTCIIKYNYIPLHYQNKQTMKHTREPWIYNRHAEIIYSGETGSRICEYPSQAKPNSDETKANFKLISLAPELLKKLIELRDSNHINITGNDWTELDLLIKKATI